MEPELTSNTLMGSSPKAETTTAFSTTSTSLAMSLVPTKVEWHPTPSSPALNHKALQAINSPAGSSPGSSLGISPRSRHRRSSITVSNQTHLQLFPSTRPVKLSEQEESDPEDTDGSFGFMNMAEKTSNRSKYPLEEYHLAGSEDGIDAHDFAYSKPATSKLAMEVDQRRKSSEEIEKKEPAGKNGRRSFSGLRRLFKRL